MTITDLAYEVYAETTCHDIALIERIARANWPDTEDFKPVQVRLLAQLIQQRSFPPAPRKDARL